MDFKDLAQQLRARPAVTWPNGNLVERLWVVEDTIPNDGFPPSPTVRSGVAATGISATSPATVLSDGAYAFTIAGPWGATFTVNVGSTTQTTTSLGLPTGTTRAQCLNALFTRFAAEHEVQPSFSSGGALCVLSSAGVNVVTAAPGPFAVGATTTKAFDPRIPAKYRRGAPHPQYDHMKVASVEISGSDQHNHNLVIYYRVDYDAMASEVGVSVDALRSWSGYEITEPNDDPAYKNVKWTFEIMNPEVYNRPANGTPHPWIPASLLTSEVLTERQGAHLVTRFYETLPGPWIWTTNDDGSDDTKSVFRRVLFASPGADAATPVGYVKTTGKLDPDNSLYAATNSFTFTKVPGDPQTAWSLDSETSLSLPSRTTLVAASTVPAFNPASPTNGTAIDANGVSTEYRPQGRYLATKIETLQIPAPASPGNPKTRSWYGSVNFYWPPVLRRLHISTIPKRDGSTDYRVVDDLVDAYNGPCKAMILERWHATLPSVLADGTGIIFDQMRPRGFQFNGARLNLSVPECLHGALTLTEFIGTLDPTYEQQVYTLAVGATNYTEWPASIVAEHDVKPWRGGWIERITTVYRPPITGTET